MAIIKNQYTHSNDYGGYTVCFGERIVEVKFNGFLSKQLIEKFCVDFELMLTVIEWESWGYYGDLTECDEESDLASDELVDLYKHFLQKGCVVDTYTITKPSVMAHIIKLRESAGITSNNNLFNNRQQAVNFIHDILFKIDKSSTN